MKINCITSPYWKKLAFDSTVRFDTKVCDSDSYMMEHSPIRTEVYFIEMKVPSFVSTHLVRHKIGVEHFVLSNRDDRGGDDDVDRDTIVKHSMIVNAEALMNMARKRLCLTSHAKTVKVMNDIKKFMEKENYILSQFMVPNCVYRNGLCPEGKNTCGKKKSIMKKYAYYKELFV